MKTAIFKIGDKVRYLGDRRVDVAKQGKHFPNPDDFTPQIFPGMVATITEVKPPQKGLGIIDQYDGDPIVDDDSDGYNIYTNEYGNTAIIWPNDKQDWKLI